MDMPFDEFFQDGRLPVSGIFLSVV